MNTGTQAAKEAGNMVDLDSNPTKLIEIVEIGKQLLITRGSLTTFSIANDVAKYFAIIPAMFAGRLPAARQASTSWACDSPHSAILSAVIFNALIIVALIPLALRGVKYRPPAAAASCCAATCSIYGVGGIIAPFVGIKLIDLLVSPHPWDGDSDATPAHPPARAWPARHARPHRAARPRLPARRHGRRPGRASTDKANGSLVTAGRQGRRLVADRPDLHRRRQRRRRVLPAPAVGRRRTATTASPVGAAPTSGPTNPDLLTTVEQRVAAYRSDERRRPVERPARRRHRVAASGLDPDISPGERRAAGRPGRRGARACPWRPWSQLVERPHRRAGRSASSASPGVNVLELNLALDALTAVTRRLSD